jgi:hypothetical protein
MAGETESRWRIHIAALLLVCTSLYAVAELAARYIVPRISNVDSRTAAEQYAALRIASAKDAAPTLLIVGNSLMRTGINIPMLQDRLRPEWRVQRFIIESADYLDWYYGIRRLLAAGSRPAAIILMLTPRQLLTDSVRGPYTAYWLFSATDTVRVGMRGGYHPTEIAGMLSGHFSAYYGKRVELRKVFFQKVVPDALALTQMLLPEKVATDTITFDQIDIQGRDRLKELKSLCRSYGVRLVFLVPTPQGPYVLRQQLIALTGELGLGGPKLDVGFGSEKLMGDGTWPDSLFADDHWHFSDEGAAAFTTNLGNALKDYL